MRTIVQHIIRLIGCIAMLSMFSSCDVHEFPDVPEKVGLNIQLRYSTDMPQFVYPIEDTRTEVPSKSVQTEGDMRYIIRFYTQNSKASRGEASHEFVFTRDLAEGYDANFYVEVPAGDYSVMVWSDIADLGSSHKFYDAKDYAAIKLVGEHEGNNDYRDAFRGISDIKLVSTMKEQVAPTIQVDMERPLAKFEFVTTDVDEFIDKEVRRMIGRGELPEQAPSKGIDISKYKVVFYYAGFMPNTYNMFTDKPVDSTVGVAFQGRVLSLNDKEASLGFDYVFVNGTESAVSLQIAILDEDNEQISRTNVISVPLRRSKHTIMKGKFLMMNAQGGVSINTKFNGDINIYF